MQEKYVTLHYLVIELLIFLKNIIFIRCTVRHCVGSVERTLHFRLNLAFAIILVHRQKCNVSKIIYIYVADGCSKKCLQVNPLPYTGTFHICNDDGELIQRFFFGSPHEYFFKVYKIKSVLSLYAPVVSSLLKKLLNKKILLASVYENTDEY
jgi:hypothetical protein